MQGQPSTYQLHIFTLRLWLEQLDHNSSEWRGEVKNTSTGEIRYFRNGLSLYTALCNMLDVSSGASRDDGKADF
jgi:hypothetical protein